MHDRITDMKGDQDQTRRTKHAPPFLKRGNEFILAQMNNAIEGGNTAKGRVSQGKRAQISLAKGECWVSLVRLGNHGAGKVNTLHPNSCGSQKRSNMTRAAAKVSHGTECSDLLGEGAE